MPSFGGADEANAPGDALLSLDRENAGPVNRRSNASSAADLTGGEPTPIAAGGSPVSAALPGCLSGSCAGGGPKSFSGLTSGRVIGPKGGSGASPDAWLREAD